MLIDLGLVVVAYLLGSISFGLLLAHLYGGGDPRQSGSGNIGATNIARTAGKTAGVLTLLGDGVKGLVAVLLEHLRHSSKLDDESFDECLRCFSNPMLPCLRAQAS